MSLFFRIFVMSVFVFPATSGGSDFTLVFERAGDTHQPAIRSCSRAYDEDYSEFEQLTRQIYREESRYAFW